MGYGFQGQGQALKRNEKDLLTCLDQLKADSVDDRKLPLSGGGQCGSSRNPTEVSVEGMRAAVRPNTVWVVVTLGKKTHALFLPTTIKRGLPVIPPR